ncbi:MAG: tyrosine--tRNA ligase [Planctomycetota bacterium]|nr:tyrosine--tRNA ligase [Planctomycetota bacterium]
MSSLELISTLRWRGLIHQATASDDVLLRHLATPRRVYVGFDPTADSLTIGNLVPAMMLVHAQRAGHRPVVVMGGGTGLIGDPSGKSSERTLMTRERVDANVASQRRIFERLLSFDGPGAATVVNNADWLGSISFLDALRDIGKYFSVNAMIQRDSVRDRLTNREQGISYTEFSYILLQSYDFQWLHEHMGVTVQMGGSDQWGNIVGGIDLIRKTGPASERTGEAAQADVGADAPAYGITAPLVTKADGGKFGKTETGAIWLTPERTSPYAYYQFWLNAADADVPKFLRTFTIMQRDEVEALEATHAADPGKREAHRALARHATALLHGEAEAAHAEAAGQALFSGDVAGLPERTLREVLANVPSSTHAKTTLEGEGVPLLDLLLSTQLASSKREAKDFLAAGSVTINGRKAGADDRVKTSDLLHGSMIAIRRGKKNWHLTTWT